MERCTIELHNADCMEIMARYPNGYFDLAIVDPPYGIGAASNAHSNLKKLGNKKWDDSPPNDVFFVNLMRVSLNQIIWGGNYFTLPPTRAFIVWDKSPMPPSYAQCEYAWTSFDMNAKKWCGKTGNETPVANRIHPTQKPVELYKWLYANYAQPGMKILDTHLGSGSNAIAAYDMDMALFVGCELDTDYYTAAKARIDQHCNQQRLF